MEIIIIIALVVILIGIWVVSTQRRLAVMDENVGSAMSQLGVQISSRYDALTTLLSLAEGYADSKSKALIEALRPRRGAITAISTPDEVLRQEEAMEAALSGIATVALEHPELKADKSYAKCMDAVDSYEKMLHTSRLIYNDGVTKLNRALRMAPASLIAGLLGFHQRDYLEAVEARERGER